MHRCGKLNLIKYTALEILYRLRQRPLTSTVALKTLVVLLPGLIAGSLFYHLNFGKHLSVASAEADAILSLTNSYVSLYSKLRQESNGALAPVPAVFRAQAALQFNDVYSNEEHLTARMVGVPERYVATPPGDEGIISTLQMMASSDTVDPYSKLLKRDGSLLLRNMYPSRATEKSCVSCHNKIQNNSELWQIGDLMGAYIIERGVDTTHRRYLFSGLFLGLLVSLLTWLGLLALKQQKRLRAYAGSLEIQANTDSLTGCLNRRALDDFFKDFDQESMANCALLLLDLDHFKTINDTHGHEAGDAVLCWFSNEVRTQLRNDEVFARVGGEEFLIYISNISAEGAKSIAQRICTHVDSSVFTYNDIAIDVTVSIGAVHTGKTANSSIARYTKNADEQLYDAKAQGRNQVVWAS